MAFWANEEGLVVCLRRGPYNTTVSEELGTVDPGLAAQLRAANEHLPPL